MWCSDVLWPLKHFQIDGWPFLSLNLYLELLHWTFLFLNKGKEMNWLQDRWTLVRGGISDELAVITILFHCLRSKLSYFLWRFYYYQKIKNSVFSSANWFLIGRFSVDSKTEKIQEVEVISQEVSVNLFLPCRRHLLFL